MTMQVSTFWADFSRRVGLFFRRKEMKFAEMTLNQKFYTINRKSESYKLILKITWRGRQFEVIGSMFLKSTKCYQATEFWCFVIQRWLDHKMSNEELINILHDIGAFRLEKDEPKSYSNNLVFINSKKKD